MWLCSLRPPRALVSRELNYVSQPTDSSYKKPSLWRSRRLRPGTRCFKRGVAVVTYAVHSSDSYLPPTARPGRATTLNPRTPTVRRTPRALLPRSQQQRQAYACTPLAGAACAAAQMRCLRATTCNARLNANDGGLPELDRLAISSREQDANAMMPEEKIRRRGPLSPPWRQHRRASPPRH